MTTEIQQVADFHQAGGHPVGNSGQPAVLTRERANSRSNWMSEEIEEFQAAIRAGDVTEALDALADLIYFALGTAVELGGQLALPLMFQRVHEANMSKFDHSEEAAKQTVLAYREQGVEVHYTQPIMLQGRAVWPVYFSEGDKAGKIAKSHKWAKPDFSNIPGL
jgi:predicted HAD superfamily Cof-like phosphohydrolase